MKKVLVVDDAVTVRLYHRQLLEKVGFTVEEAGNGVEALEKAALENFDLFLVDVNMPKMDGYRLVSEIRNTPAYAAIPVIMVSTEAADIDKEKAFDAGSNLYLVKPVRDVQIQAYARLMTGSG